MCASMSASTVHRWEMCLFYTNFILKYKIIKKKLLMCATMQLCVIVLHDFFFFYWISSIWMLCKIKGKTNGENVENEVTMEEWENFSGGTKTIWLITRVATLHKEWRQKTIRSKNGNEFRHLLYIECMWRATTITRCRIAKTNNKISIK